MKTVPGWQPSSGGELRLGKGFAEGVGHAHNFAGGLHLRTEHGVHAGKFRPREDRRLHKVAVAGVEIVAARHFRAGIRAVCVRSSGERQSSPAECRSPWKHRARFARRAGSLRARKLCHPRAIALNRELHIHQADHFSARASLKVYSRMVSSSARAISTAAARRRNRRSGCRLPRCAA